MQAASLGRNKLGVVTAGCKLVSVAPKSALIAGASSVSSEVTSVAGAVAARSEVAAVMAVGATAVNAESATALSVLEKQVVSKVAGLPCEAIKKRRQEKNIKNVYSGQMWI